MNLSTDLVWQRLILKEIFQVYITDFLPHYTKAIAGRDCIRPWYSCLIESTFLRQKVSLRVATCGNYSVWANIMIIFRPNLVTAVRNGGHIHDRLLCHILGWSRCYACAKTTLNSAWQATSICLVHLLLIVSGRYSPAGKASLWACTNLGLALFTRSKVAIVQVPEPLAALLHSGVACYSRSSLALRVIITWQDEFVAVEGSD